MDTQIQVRVGRLEEPLQSFTATELIEKLESSSSLLQSLDFGWKVTASRQQSPAWVPWHGVGFSRIQKEFIRLGYTALHQVVSSYHSEYISEQIKGWVNRLIIQNIASVLSLHKRLSAAKCCGVLASRDGQKLLFEVVARPSGYCDRCGRLMSKVTEIHRNSAKCLQEAAHRAGKFSGMSLVEDRALKSALMKIPNSGAKLVPTEYELWAPKWATAAYSMWKSNSKSYSDMKLHEFLQQMNPIDTDAQSK